MFSVTSRVAAADWVTPVETVSAFSAARATFWAISRVVMLCSSTAEAMVREASFTWVTTRLISERLHRFARRSLDALDAAANIFGGLRGLLGQLLDFGGHDGKALAGVAGAGGLDRGIQRQQIGLLGDVLDHFDHLADLDGSDTEIADLLIAGLGRAGCAVGHAGRALRRCGPPRRWRRSSVPRPTPPI